MNKQQSLLATSVISLAFGMGIAVKAQAITVIDTTPQWNGSDSIRSIGEPNSATYGQTFSINGADNILGNFSFFFDHSYGDDVDFAAYVAEWDGSKAVGPILYSSSQQTLSASSSGFQEFSFNTGNVQLETGKQYVSFFSASSFFDGQSGMASLGSIAPGFGSSNAYSGGNFVYQNNGSNFNSLFSSAWSGANGSGFGKNDAAFKLSLSSNNGQPAKDVPEPMTILGTILAGGYGIHRKHKNKLAASADA